VTAKGNKLNCARCGKESIAGANGQKYCSPECRHANWMEQKKGQLSKRKCTLCGDYYLGRRGRKFCSPACANTLKFAIWTDLEIIYLASLNPGYGFKNFIGTIYNRKQESGNDKTQLRVLDILQKMKEDTGNDYYEWLQNPDYMETMKLGDYVTKHGKQHVPKFQGRHGGRGVPIMNSAIRIKTDKNIEFQWGKFADDHRVRGK